jgi:hypothetical protein
LTFTPARDTNGTAHVTVNALAAQGGETLTRSFTVKVLAINDPPSFTAGPDQSVAENAGAQSVVTWARAISAGPPDESGQSISFAVANTSPSLFAPGGQPTVTADGTLTFVPAAFASGTAT